MISDPVSIMRCDGPATAPAECRRAEIVRFQFGLSHADARHFAGALFRDWLVTPERVRCPQCLAVDVAAVEHARAAAEAQSDAENAASGI